MKRTRISAMPTADRHQMSQSCTFLPEPYIVVPKYRVGNNDYINETEI